jgi:adenylate cyclase
MPYFLVCNLGTSNETYYPLQPGKNAIGRARDNDIVVLHGSLSRHHAEIIAIYYRSEQSPAENPEKPAKACITIRDRQSLNGTAINNTRIQQGEIQEGDLITLGKVNFKLIYSADQAEQTAVTRSPRLGVSYIESETD